MTKGAVLPPLIPSKFRHLSPQKTDFIPQALDLVEE
jgi:hypothetical protein